MAAQTAAKEKQPNSTETPVHVVRGRQALSAVTTSAKQRRVIDAPRNGAFTAPPEIYSQEGPLGIRFDFNHGCRISVPAASGEWRIVARDYGTDVTIFDLNIKAEADKSNGAMSTKKFFVPFEFTVSKDGKEVFSHRMNLKGKKVLIQFPVGTLGDLMGWFPYAVKFQKQHDCDLTVAMGAPLIELFEKEYPEIEFVTPEYVAPIEYYATYNIGLFFTDEKNEMQPSDFRLVGLHRTAGYILGVDPTEERPRMHLPDDSRPIPEKYVCIATQASTQCKYWNNADGWRETIKFLKDAGYRVICIDQKPVHGLGVVQNQIPHGCEDETGNRPLAERARWLKHAEFFVGLSSGLAWVAWAAGIPVVMISGFTHPINEFETPYRVVNYHACNSCWNDPKVLFNHQDFMWCPKKAGTPQQFECTRLITAGQVRQTIEKIPGFGKA